MLGFAKTGLSHTSTLSLRDDADFEFCLEPPPSDPLKDGERAHKKYKKSRQYSQDMRAAQQRANYM